MGGRKDNNNCRNTLYESSDLTAAVATIIHAQAAETKYYTFWQLLLGIVRI